MAVTLREHLWSDLSKRKVLWDLLDWRDQLAQPATQAAWEEIGKVILPPGKHPFPAELLGQGTRSNGRKPLMRYQRERLEFLASLGPEKWVRGRVSLLGRREYIVAVFPDLVVAESPKWGNAAYLVDRNRGRSWREVLVLSKREALAAGALRVIHKGDWKGLLSALVS